MSTSQSLPQDAPLVVVWRVTEHCPLACGFCGYDRRIPKHRGSVILDDVLVLGAVLGEYSRRFGRRVHVSWLGGEPLLWPHLAEVSRRFHQEFRLGLGVTTNGVSLSQESMRTLLAECYEQVTISLDGLGAAHDDLRNAPGLFAQLRRDVARLKAVSAGRLLLRVNTVLMRDNIARFPQLAAEVARWGCHELTFNQLGGNDRPEFFAQHRLLPSQVVEFRRGLPALRREMATRGLRIPGSTPYLDRITASTAGTRIAIDDCSPGTRFLFVDERGRIAPCSFTAAEYGRLLSAYTSAGSLAEIADDFRHARQESRHPMCDDCHATHVCGKFHDPAAPLSGKELHEYAIQS